jgi:predicted phage tail protein
MADKYGKTVKLAGDNMFQLMSGLVSRFGSQFKEDVRNNNWHLVEGRFNDDVRQGRVKKVNDIGENELGKTLARKTLHLIPAVEGASNAIRIVVGVVLIAVGLYFDQPWLVNIGVSMVVGGITDMLTKPRVGSPEQKENERGSSIYNGALNVTTQGGPIPLIYGRVQRASSVVISTDFSSDEA